MNAPKNFWKYLLAFTILCCVSSLPLFGQAASGTAAITGLITDASGAAVTDANVVVRNVSTNVIRNLKSNEAGVYEAVALQPGPYEVKASKATHWVANAVAWIAPRCVGGMAARTCPTPASPWCVWTQRSLARMALPRT